MKTGTTQGGSGYLLMMIEVAGGEFFSMQSYILLRFTQTLRNRLASTSRCKRILIQPILQDQPESFSSKEIGHCSMNESVT